MSRGCGDVSGDEMVTQTHSSCPDLIRASIKPQKSIFEERWIAGSSPAMTEGKAAPGYKPNIAPQHDGIHHPANGQWPFGRLLCKGSQQVTKRPGKRAAGRPFPFKNELGGT